MSDIKVCNVNVYGIREALIGAGYPMATIIGDMDADKRTIEDMLRLGSNLGHSPIGHGDDKFLRQIPVIFDLIAPRYFWAQFDTYGVFTTKNSQSTMHKGKALNYDVLANRHVDSVILTRFREFVKQYQENPTEENLLKVKSNFPEGIRLGARISTNYAQLRTMYYQRKTHRLPEWREFCAWIETLPYAKELGIC